MAMTLGRHHTALKQHSCHENLIRNLWTFPRAPNAVAMLGWSHDGDKTVDREPNGA
jgi:hypothetical protein